MEQIQANGQKKKENCSNQLFPLFQQVLVCKLEIKMIDSTDREEYENLKDFVKDVDALRTGKWDGKDFYQSDRPTPLQPRNEERVRDLIETYYPYLHFGTLKQTGGLEGLCKMSFAKLKPFFDFAYTLAVVKIKEIEK